MPKVHTIKKNERTTAVKRKLYEFNYLMQQMKTMKYLMYIILLVFLSCTQKKEQKGEELFDNREYFLPEINWKTAYDSVNFTNSEMIIKNENSVYGIIYPGSLVLNKDTISVNEEAGYPNKCVKIGELKVDDSTYVYKNKSIFKVINDSTIKFNNKIFMKTKRKVINGCWCEWK